MCHNLPPMLLACRDDFFTCDTGSPACIPLNWTCDGVPNDCPDNSDESNCGKYA